MILDVPPALILSDHKNKVVGIHSDESYLYTCGPGYVPEGHSYPLDTVYIYSKEKDFMLDGMLVGYGQDIRCVASDANWIYTGGGGGKDLTGYRYSALRIYDKKTQLLRDDWGADEYWITSVLSDNVHLFAGTSDGSIDVYDAVSLKSVKSLYKHDGRVGVTRLCSDGTYLYSAASGKTIVLWDKKKLEHAKSLDGEGCELVDLSVGDDFIFSTSDDGQILSWNKAGFALHEKTRVYENGPHHVTLNGNAIIVGGAEMVIKVLTSPDLQETRSFTSGKSPVTALHADGAHLYVGHENGTVTVVDISTVT